VQKLKYLNTAFEWQPIFGRGRGPYTAKLTRIIVRIKHVGVTSATLLKLFGVFKILVGKS
jgi:hypothetical protein